jgi:sigma-E factor negative regulatory protein RseB
MRGALRLLAGACFVVPFLGQAADSPAAWLIQVSAAARTVSYQGTLVYRDESDRLETLRIVHRVKRDLEQERISTLNGRTRDVFRENGRVIGVLEDSAPAARVLPDKLMPALTAETLQQLAAHYEVRDLGSGRIAGRVSRGVEIAPKDGYRYGYQIWADATTAVPLKVTLLAAHGRVLEQVMFTDIDYPARIQDSVFALPPEARTGTALADAPAAAVVAVVAVADGRWRLGAVPAGFAVILRTQPPGEKEVGVEHMQLSDGLSAVSIFS